MSSISDSIATQLRELAMRDLKLGIKAMFADDASRADTYSFDLDSIHIDFSKTHISQALLDVYDILAGDIDFISQRQALFSGEKVNVTEQRSVLHMLLRNPENQGISMVSEDLLDQAKQAEQQFAEQLAALEDQLQQRELPVKQIIHVGIGGSALGPRLVYEALKPLNSDQQIYFVGNIDAHELTAVLSQCEPKTTLVVGVSKTFTTAETLKNLDSIAAWLADAGMQRPRERFIAVTANPINAIAYGVSEENIVAFPNWVGGRYSVWSSVSLSIALVIGWPAFQQFLAGAAKVDQHFYQSSTRDNLPFIAAALDHYYANFMQAGSRAIFAYDYRLRSLVDYLQQLETESNGKDRQKDGSLVDQKTSPVIWGGVGTDVQHSVFQMLHQGTSVIPAEFMLVAKADHDLDDHHLELLANGLAQPAALLAGQDRETVARLHADEPLSDAILQAKQFTGDRPSTTFLIEKLTPFTLGSLLAFYEHRTFCFGVLTNINSYDQMGVELGKRLAKQIKPLIEHQSSDSAVSDEIKKRAEEFDSSTRHLLAKLKA